MNAGQRLALGLEHFDGDDLYEVAKAIHRAATVVADGTIDEPSGLVVTNDAATGDVGHPLIAHLKGKHRQHLGHRLHEAGQGGVEFSPVVPHAITVIITVNTVNMKNEAGTPRRLRSEYIGDSHGPRTPLLRCSTPLLLLALALAPVLSGCPKTAAAKPSSKAASSQVDTFDYVWQRVGNSFPDADMNGVDWQAVRDELRPQAEAAADPDALRPILKDMLSRVGVSHFAIVPGRIYRPRGTGPRGDLGFDAGLVDGAVHVLSVRDGGPAVQAGLQPGDRIDQLGDVVLAEVLAELSSSDSPRGPAAAIGSLMRELVHQPIGEPCAVHIVRGDTTPAPITIRPGPLQGEVFKMGELPATLVETSSHIDDPDGDGPIPPVLVIRFSMFAMPSAIAIRRAVIDASAQGIDLAVVDLRGNPGGMLDVARGIAGHFVPRRSASLGTFRTREANLELSIRPRISAERIDGNIAVIIDGRSASSSEVLASGLQDLDRATIVGEQSSGLALMSAFESLPNGDRMQFVFADLTSPNGHRLEGVGVTPDLIVSSTAAALRSGHDLPLEAALAAVRAPESP